MPLRGEPHGCAPQLQVHRLQLRFRLIDLVGGEVAVLRARDVRLQAGPSAAERCLRVLSAARGGAAIEVAAGHGGVAADHGAHERLGAALPNALRRCTHPCRPVLGRRAVAPFRRHASAGLEAPAWRHGSLGTRRMLLCPRRTRTTKMGTLPTPFNCQRHQDTHDTAPVAKDLQIWEHEMRHRELMPCPTARKTIVVAACRTGLSCQHTKSFLPCPPGNTKDAMSNSKLKHPGQTNALRIHETRPALSNMQAFPHPQQVGASQTAPANSWPTATERQAKPT